MQTVSVPSLTPAMQEKVDFGKEFMESMKHSPFYLDFPANKTNGLFSLIIGGLIVEKKWRRGPIDSKNRMDNTIIGHGRH
jgi:hypothetical protein